MPGKWSLDCSIESIRQSLRERGFFVPDLYTQAVSSALGGRYSPAQVQEEGDANVEWRMSTWTDIEARRTGRGSPEMPITQEFYNLPGDVKDDVQETLIKQKLLEASQIDIGPEIIVDKKGLKNYCKSVAKKHEYERLSATSYEKHFAEKENFWVEMSLNTGGSHTQYWSTRAAYFSFGYGDLSSLPDLIFMSISGFSYYHSAMPSERELERVRSLARQRSGVPSMKALNAFHALHPSASEELSNELKLGVTARFNLADVLMPHLHFKADPTSTSASHG